MATLLSTTTGSNPNIGWAVYSSVVSRTPTAVTVDYTVKCWMVTSNGYLGTGHTLVGYIGGHALTFKTSSTGISGGWSKSLTKRITHSVSTGATSVGVKFKGVNGYGNAGDLSERTLYVSFSSASASYGNISFSGEAIDQTKAKATLSGAPNVGYETSIEWYIGDTKVATTKRAASTSTNAYSYTFSGLLPNTTYTLKAIVYGVSTAMSTKTDTITTPNETGVLTVTPKPTYLTADISSMFDEPNYTRQIEVYVKKSADTDYKLFKTVSEQSNIASVNITGLISNVSYDVKVLIKNGTTILKTLTKTGIVTIKDTSLIPTPHIETITQKLGTRECTIAWLTDKSVAGTTYQIQAKADGDTEWTVLGIASDVTSPIMVVSHAGNNNVTFRIAATNEAVASSITNYSDTVVFYVRDDFVWDTDKVKGVPFKISANEWNRLREYVISCNADMGNVVSISMVRAGDIITASTYNNMKNAISNATPINIADKRKGDAISAVDIDALRVAINAVTV